MSLYVIYNKETTSIFQVPARSVGCYVSNYKTAGAAKAALTRAVKKGVISNRDDFAIAEAGNFRTNIEEMVERVNIMTGKTYMEAKNTPNCVSPSSETYWCM